MQALIDNYTTLETHNISDSSVTMGFYRTNHIPWYSSIFINTINQPPVLNFRITKLLNEYLMLDDNWDEDDAKAPDKVAVEKALYLNSLFERHGQPIFHAAPGPNGEVMLDIRNKQKTKSLEIVLYASRSVAVCFPEDGKAFQKEFDNDNLPLLLEWVNSK